MTTATAPRSRLDPARPDSDRLFHANMALARKLARRYRQCSVPMEDLEQVAMIGLMLAARRFDPDRGKPFAGFATPTILGELRRHLRDHGRLVHVTRGAQERSSAIRTAREALTVEHKRAPTVQQLAQYLEMDIGEVLDGLIALNAFDTRSIDGPPAGDAEAPSLADTLGEAEPGFELAEGRAVLERAMSELSERERELLALRYDDEWTQAAIGERLGCSQMQVSRIERKAIERLRRAAGE